MNCFTFDILGNVRLKQNISISATTNMPDMSAHNLPLQQSFHVIVARLALKSIFKTAFNNRELDCLVLSAGCATSTFQ